MPAADVDRVEAAFPGWIAQQLADHTAYIDTRLRKRYAAPFLVPYPIAALKWLTQLVTIRVYFKRGINPDDAQFPLIQKDADTAEAEVTEAANSEIGLFDLPLRADTTATGVSKGGPFGSSDASPYSWIDQQAEAVRNG